MSEQEYTVSANEEIVAEETPKKKGLSANAKNNLRALGTVGIALLVLAAVIFVCELYQYLCLNDWARIKS